MEIKIFTSPNFGAIRTSGTSNRPLFCATDVAKALGYARPADAVSDHCKGVSILPTPTNGGIQQLKFISESDLYRLVMRSKLEAAENFQDWVCEEVLPSIRKDGGYIAASSFDSEADIMAKALLIAQATLDRQSKRVQQLETTIASQAPKVLFATAVETSTKSILIGELAKIISQNGYPIGQNRLFKWLRKHYYLCSVGERYNMPMQRYIEQGIFEIKKTTISKPDGTILVSNTVKVTGKGQIYFVNKFLSKK